MDDDFIHLPDNSARNESNQTTTPGKSKIKSPGAFCNAQIGFRDIVNILENKDLQNVLTAPITMVKPFSSAGEVRLNL